MKMFEQIFKLITSSIITLIVNSKLEYDLNIILTV